MFVTTKRSAREVLRAAKTMRGGVVVAVLVLCLACAHMSDIVRAHQSPGGCNSNRFNISIVKDRTEVYQGQTLTYTVTASNTNDGSNIACDITSATIQVRLPAADGTPTGSVVVLGTGLNFPGGTGTTLIGSAQYVVNVNPGVTDIVAEAQGEGDLHDAPVDHDALIVKTVGTSVVAPPSTTSTSTAAASASATPRLPNTGVAPAR